MDEAVSFPSLCKTCQRKGFQDLCYTEPSTVEMDSLELGSVADIMRRSFSCNFCSFILQHCQEALRPELCGRTPTLPSSIDVRLDLEPAGRKPFSENPDVSGRPVSDLAVVSKPFTGKKVFLHPCAFPIPSVRDYWNSPGLFLQDTKHTFSGRLIEPMLDVKLLIKWLEICEQLHGDLCSSPDWLQSDEYPSRLRLIDVKTMSLVNADGTWRYVCLSYVWGPPSGQLRTTKQTIQDLQTEGGLRQCTLPRTISDAIRLVQDLGERYLWVDALCILQDDDNDKQFQISQMDLIYSRGLLTIAVATGNNSDAGIPHLYRQIRKTRQDYVQVSSDFALMISEPNGIVSESDSKWSYRGWTYQELQLSRRAVIFYKDIVHWKCECDYWNESCCLEPTGTQIDQKCDPKLRISLNMAFIGPKFDIAQLGAHVLHFNYLRKFTEEGDALDAFLGILKRITYASQITFHWGLPRQRFHHSLLWMDEEMSGYREGPRRNAKCRLVSTDGTVRRVPLPSWSWIGWYTHLNRPVYDSKGYLMAAEGLRPSHLTWAAEWFRLDVQSNMFPIEASMENLPQRLFPPPEWAGDPLEATKVTVTPPWQDTAWIRTRTSWAKCRVRTQLYSMLTRQKGLPPKDSHYYCILNEAMEIIGKTVATDFFCSTEEYIEEEAVKEKKQGRVREFIVISREEAPPEPQKRSGWDWDDTESDDDWADENPKPTPMLNLMMIQRDPEVPEVASRLGIFRMEEEFWLKCQPEWKQITLR